MNPQSQNPAIDVPSASINGSEGPATHPPSGFHAPSQTASHYDMPVPAQTKLPTAPRQTTPLTVAPIAQAVKPIKDVPISAADMLAQYNAPPDTRAEVAADDVDTSFDEEWVLKAQELVSRTKGDPFLQSQEMGKLKAAYVKARYNKTIKVSE